ncbi:MAG TPA: hypothetical protein VGM88_10975 [Kofleriaceae bacterium]|jgi:hypothetical protein
MEVAQIYRTLVDATHDGALALPAAAFGAGSVARLVEAIGGTLALGDVAIDERATEVGVSGNGTVAPLLGMRVTATFAPGAAGDPVAIALAAEPADATTWTFATSWPLLADSPAAALVATGVRIALDSAAAAPRLDATVALGDAWRGLGWAYHLIAPTPLAGDFATHDGVPELRLAAQIESTLTLGRYALPLSLVLACSRLSTNRGALPQVALGLTATLPLHPDVPLTVGLEAPFGPIAVRADTAALSAAGLDALTGLAGEVLRLPVIPGGFDPSDVLSLAELDLVLDPAAGTLVSFGARFRIGGDGWRVLGFGIGGLDLWIWFSPHTTPKLSAMISGSVELVPGGTIEFSAGTAGGFQLQAGLADGASLPVTALLEALHIGDVGLPDSLRITELDLYLEPDTGSASVAAEISDWPLLSVGPVSLVLDQAGVELARTDDEYSAMVAARLRLGDVWFAGEWRMPGALVLSAGNAHLAKLVGALGVPVPSWLDHLDPTLEALVLTLAREADAYAFGLDCRATLGDVALEAALGIVDGDAGWGFALGCQAGLDWSPGRSWRALAPVFDELSLRQMGVIFTNVRGPLPAPLVALFAGFPALPGRLADRIVVFATLAFDDRGFLRHLVRFLAGVTLTLSAEIDLEIPGASSISATLAPAARDVAGGIFRFDDLRLMLTATPPAAAFTADITLVPPVGGPVPLSGTIDVTSAGAIDLTLDLGGPEPGQGWREPLGIPFLVIDNFALTATINELLELKVIGTVTIGDADRAFRFTVGGAISVDLGWPTALILKLDAANARTLRLTDLVGQFCPGVSLDDVPIFSQIGFRALDFWIVADPAGFPLGHGMSLSFGLGIEADVTLYEWDASVGLTLDWQRGVVAKGELSKPIRVFDVLAISSATEPETKGPRAGIDTSVILSGGAYVTLDGRIDLLGATIEAAAEARGTTFSLDVAFDFREAIRGCMKVAVDLLAGGTAEVHVPPFALHAETKAYEVDGITLVPATRFDGPSAALSGSLAIGAHSSFSLSLAFAWRGVDLAFDLALDAVQLAALDRAIVDWIADHAAEVFHDALDTAEHWVDAIANGAIALGDDIIRVAEALWNHFGVAAAVTLLDLLDRIGYGFEELVHALVKVAKLSPEAAAKLVASAIGGGGCAATTGDTMLFGRDTAPALFRLAADADGQALLGFAHAHPDAARRLPTAGTLGDTAAALRALAGNEDAVALADRLAARAAVRWDELLGEAP